MFITNEKLKITTSSGMYKAVYIVKVVVYWHFDRES